MLPDALIDRSVVDAALAALHFQPEEEQGAASEAAFLAFHLLFPQRPEKRHDSGLASALSPAISWPSGGSQVRGASFPSSILPVPSLIHGGNVEHTAETASSADLSRGSLVAGSTEEVQEEGESGGVAFATPARATAALLCESEWRRKFDVSEAFSFVGATARPMRRAIHGTLTSQILGPLTSLSSVSLALLSKVPDGHFSLLRPSPGRSQGEAICSKLSAFSSSERVFGPGDNIGPSANKDGERAALIRKDGGKAALADAFRKAALAFFGLGPQTSNGQVATPFEARLVKGLSLSAPVENNERPSKRLAPLDASWRQLVVSEPIGAFDLDTSDEEQAQEELPVPVLLAKAAIAFLQSQQQPKRQRKDGCGPTTRGEAHGPTVMFGGATAALRWDASREDFVFFVQRRALLSAAPSGGHVLSLRQGPVGLAGDTVASVTRSCRHQPQNLASSTQALLLLPPPVPESLGEERNSKIAEEAEEDEAGALSNTPAKETTSLLSRGLTKSVGKGASLSPFLVALRRKHLEEPSRIIVLDAVGTAGLSAGLSASRISRASPPHAGAAFVTSRVTLSSWWGSAQAGGFAPNLTALSREPCSAAPLTLPEALRQLLARRTTGAFDNFVFGSPSCPGLATVGEIALMVKASLLPPPPSRAGASRRSLLYAAPGSTTYSIFRDYPAHSPEFLFFPASCRHFDDVRFAKLVVEGERTQANLAESLVADASQFLSVASERERSRARAGTELLRKSAILVEPFRVHGFAVSPSADTAKFHSLFRQTGDGLTGGKTRCVVSTAAGSRSQSSSAFGWPWEVPADMCRANSKKIAAQCASSTPLSLPATVGGLNELQLADSIVVATATSASGPVNAPRGANFRIRTHLVTALASDQFPLVPESEQGVDALRLAADRRDACRLQLARAGSGKNPAPLAYEQAALAHAALGALTAVVPPEDKALPQLLLDRAGHVDARKESSGLQGLPALPILSIGPKPAPPPHALAPNPSPTAGNLLLALGDGHLSSNRAEKPTAKVSFTPPPISLSASTGLKRRRTQENPAAPEGSASVEASTSVKPQAGAEGHRGLSNLEMAKMARKIESERRKDHGLADDDLRIAAAQTGLGRMPALNPSSSDGASGTADLFHADLEHAEKEEKREVDEASMAPPAAKRARKEEAQADGGLVPYAASHLANPPFLPFPALQPAFPPAVGSGPLGPPSAFGSPQILPGESAAPGPGGFFIASKRVNLAQVPAISGSPSLKMPAHAAANEESQGPQI